LDRRTAARPRGHLQSTPVEGAIAEWLQDHGLVPITEHPVRPFAEAIAERLALEPAAFQRLRDTARGCAAAFRMQAHVAAFEAG
jgi:hypothetical protein